jgi:putative transposase
MPNYRRNFVPGGTYFFTVVTHERRPLFLHAQARRLLHSAIQTVQAKRSFVIVAMVLLPEHLHCVWTMPDEDANYSTRWRQIKEAFTRSFLQAGGEEGVVSESRRSHNERAVWQRRFWEHTCRDQDDLNRCIDYVHWNPVKHGLVMRLIDYPWSSFHRFVAQGIYPPDWGSADPWPRNDAPEWE